MSKIPTAEEKLKANFFNGSFIEIHSGDLKDIENIMIEFAKRHVEAALKAANIEMLKFVDEKEQDEYKPQVLNAYPLENIK